MNNPRPWLKQALEYGPLILFFVAYTLLKHHSLTIGGNTYSGFILATLIFVPVTVVTTFALWRLTGRLSAMQIVTVVLLVVLGGLSVWLNDPRFFKMKPTLVYLLFAGILGLGLALRRDWLQLALGEVMPRIDAQGWRLLTGRVALLFLGLAVLNEVVWRLMSEGAWVNFKIFGVTVILFAFFAAQSGLLRRHALGPAPEEGGPDLPSGGA